MGQSSLGRSVGSSGGGSWNRTGGQSSATGALGGLRLMRVPYLGRVLVTMCEVVVVAVSSGAVGRAGESSGGMLVILGGKEEEMGLEIHRAPATKCNLERS